MGFPYCRFLIDKKGHTHFNCCPYTSSDGRLSEPHQSQIFLTVLKPLIDKIEVIARGSGIHELRRLRKCYGFGNWRKLKGIARIRLPSGRVTLAELHWYEAHGIEKEEIKRKKYLD